MELLSLVQLRPELGVEEGYRKGWDFLSSVDGIVYNNKNGILDEALKWIRYKESTWESDDLMQFYVEPILLLDSGTKLENVINYHNSYPKNLLGYNPDMVFQLGGIIWGMVFFIGIPSVPIQITPE